MMELNERYRSFVIGRIDMRRIAILSDIHSNLDALKLIYSDTLNMNIDEIFHLGDAIAIGPEPKEVLDFIITNNIVSLKGNHEMYYLDIISKRSSNIGSGELEHQLWVSNELGNKYFEYITSLKHNICYCYEGIRINMCHFPYTLTDNKFDWFHSFDVRVNKELFANEADIYVYGHQHNGGEFIDDEGNRFINLRSSGATWLDETSYLIIEICDGNYKVENRIIPYERSIIGHKLDNKEVPSKEFIKKAFFELEE